MKKLMNQKMKKKLTIAGAVLLVVTMLVAGLSIRGMLKQHNEIAQMKAKMEELEGNRSKTDTIREEVKQISQYAAYEYNYTSVIKVKDYNKVKGVEIPLTGNQYIATMENRMSIGIDGEKVDAYTENNEDGNVEVVHVSVPRSMILSNNPVADSMKVYDEQNNIFNPVKVKDYMDLVVEEEQKEQKKVEESDVLQRSDKQIENIIRSHFKALYGDEIVIDYQFVDQGSKAKNG